jgi:hypothetical protein
MKNLNQNNILEWIRVLLDVPDFDWVMVFLMLGVDYLDREPDSILNEETAFRNFVNFQSYTEELYHLFPIFPSTILWWQLITTGEKT